MKESLKPLGQNRGYVNYGVSEGDVESYGYQCPCGKGTITEEHKNVPGFTDHKISINCKACRKKYEIDLRNGYRAWDLKAKVKNK